MRAPTLLALLASLAVASAAVGVTVTVNGNSAVVAVSAQSGDGHVGLYHDLAGTLSGNIEQRAVGAPQVMAAAGGSVTFNNVPSGKYYAIFKPDGAGDAVASTLASVPDAACFTGTDASSKVTYVTKDTAFQGSQSDLAGNALTLVFSEPRRFADISYTFQHGLTGYTSAIDTSCNLAFGQDSTSSGKVAWARNWASAPTGCVSKAVATIADVNGQLGSCGWDRDETLVNSTVFRSIIKITTVSQGIVIRKYLYTVTEETAVSLGLEYKSAVSANATTIIYGPRGLSADLYGTYFDPATGGKETFEVAFVTSVQKPYQLIAAATNKISVADASAWDVDISLNAASSDTRTHFHMEKMDAALFSFDNNNQRPSCLNIAGTDLATATDADFSAVGGTGACTQFWHSVLTRSGEKSCANTPKDPRKLDAAFTLNFAVTCDPTWTGSCNTPDPATASFSVSTTSDNYCPQIFDTRSATAELRVYDSSAARDTWTATAGSGLGTQSQFVFGTTSYFRVRMDSSGVTMYGAKAEQISIIKGFKTDNSAGNGGGVARQVLYRHAFDSNPTWWSDSADHKVSGTDFAVTVASTPAANLAVDFSFKWDSDTSSASGDEPTDTQINYVGRVRWTTGGLSILSAKMTRVGMSALADGATSATARVGIAQPSSSSATAGSSAGVSSATIAIGAAVAGVALVAAGVAAHTVRSKRQEQARKTSHMASVALSIPEASAPTTA